MDLEEDNFTEEDLPDDGMDWGEEEEADGWEDEDMEGGWDAEEMKQPMPVPPTFSRGFSQDSAGGPALKIVSIQGVLVIRNQDIQEVVDVYDVSEGEAEILLRYFKWNKANAIEALSQSYSETLTKAGVRGVVSGPALEQGKTTPCQVCFDDVSESTGGALSCHHYICNDCWKGWIRAELDKGPMVLTSRCPGYQCTVTIPSSILFQYAPTEMVPKLEYYMASDYVGCRYDMKWCPLTGCDHAAFSENYDMVVKCRCNRYWCFGCAMSDHSPANCENAKLWLDKCISDGENLVWIKAHTKTCPKCKVNIEKNQGCQHMTCRMCKHEFCWLCKGDWRSHRNCAPDNAAVKEKAVRNQAKSDIQRFMFYYERYENHDKSIGFTSKAQDKFDFKVQISGSSMKFSLSYVDDAFQEVMECHRVLKWANVYCYQLAICDKTDSSEYALFMDQYNLLTNFTDQLTELLEFGMSNAMEVAESNGLTQEGQLSALLYSEDYPKKRFVNLTEIIHKYRTNVLSGMLKMQNK